MPESPTTSNRRRLQRILGVQSESKPDRVERLGEDGNRAFLERRDAYIDHGHEQWVARVLAMRDFAPGQPEGGGPFDPEIPSPSPTSPTLVGPSAGSPPPAAISREQLEALLEQLPTGGDPNKIAHWVFDHMGAPIEHLDPVESECPSRGAWFHLQTCQQDVAVRKAFMAEYQRRFWQKDNAQANMLVDDARDLANFALELACLEEEALAG